MCDGRERKTRRFILEFYKAINGIKKTRILLAPFISDPKFMNHLLFLEQLVPEFSLIPEEITTEQDRVIVKAKISGKHAGKMEGIPPTGQTIHTMFAAGYRIENKKIVDHWVITDQLELIKQLGLDTQMDKLIKNNPDLFNV